jgi:hypothetical protein
MEKAFLQDAQVVEDVDHRGEGFLFLSAFGNVV